MPGLEITPSLGVYFSVFVAGVATSFTPCVYPLIPMIMGIIGASQEKSRLRNFVLSLSYCLGLALTFSLLGLIAALSGSLFGRLQTSPVAHLIVGAVIILFGLSLLDVIRLPTFLLNRIGMGRINKSASLLGVFVMGAVSGLVAAPCTVAVLGAVLTYVATTRNAFVGFSLLFTFAAGLSTLLIIAGTFSGILSGLTRSGKWTLVIQKALAWALIFLGEYFIFKAGSLSL